MSTPLVIHGHFYQPPRENPWTGAVEREPSAHPDHDWNERIHRAILPLCNDRDRRTQIRWGLTDFMVRFGRVPESLWLPETACNTATLDALIDEQLRYVILSPYRAALRRVSQRRQRPLDRDRLLRRSDLSRARVRGRARDEPGAGRSPGPRARRTRSPDPHRDRRRELRAPHPPRRSLARARRHGRGGDAWLHPHQLRGVPGPPPDCGCSGGAADGWNQAWRTPLRAALDLVRDAAAARFAETRGILFHDPWATRTSCGWFFADISGIETVQVMKYAQRALDLLADLDLGDLRDRFLDQLAEAKSNLPVMGNGADVFRRFVDPLRVNPGRIAAHVAISSLVDDTPVLGVAAGYRYHATNLRRQRHGRLSLATAKVELDERATERRHELGVAAMHFGGVDFYCVVRPFEGAHRFAAATARLWAQFRTASLPTMLRIAQEELGPDEYGLDSLLPQGRRRVSDMVLAEIVGNFAAQYAQLYENNQRILEMLQSAGLELPPELLAAAELTFSRRFEDALRQAGGSHDPASYAAASLMSRTLAGVAHDAVTVPAAERTRRACELAEVACALGLEASLGRAQEIIAEAYPHTVDDPLGRALRRGFGMVARRDDVLQEAHG